MDTMLVTLFRHNRWANLRLLNAVAALTPAQLDASAPGTYGTIGETLAHMATGEQRYVARVRGEPRPEGHAPRGARPLPELRASFEATGDALVELARTLDPAKIVRGWWDMEPAEMPAWVPLLEAIDHGREHRTNITTIMDALGVSAPQLDVWAYGDSLTK